MYEPSRWLPHYGPGYQHLSRSERRAITDFVMVWSLFEAQVLNCNASADRMLEAVASWQSAGLIEGLSIEDAWNHFLERLALNGELTYRFEGLRLKRPDHKEFLKKAFLAEAPGPDALT